MAASSSSALLPASFKDFAKAKKDATFIVDYFTWHGSFHTLDLGEGQKKIEAFMTAMIDAEKELLAHLKPKIKGFKKKKGTSDAKIRAAKAGAKSVTTAVGGKPQKLGDFDEYYLLKGTRGHTGFKFSLVDQADIQSLACFNAWVKLIPLFFSEVDSAPFKDGFKKFHAKYVVGSGEALNAKISKSRPKITKAAEALDWI